MAATASTDDIYRVLSTAVDPVFYRSIYDDLKAAAIDPVAHYAATGWEEGRDPAPWFSTSAYLRVHDDVVGNPLYHYLTRGRAEGREIVRSEWAGGYLIETARQPAVGWTYELASRPRRLLRAVAAQVAETLGLAPVKTRGVIAEAFDAKHYLAANPDVAAAGVDPLDHFLSSGWKEGRDPTPSFSMRDYLELYPDVAQAGMNPFHHYLTAGRAEGRVTRFDFGFRHDIIAHLKPMEERMAAAARVSSAARLAAAGDVARAMATSRSGLADLHVTFSHDDYSANVGGVQLCLQREAARMAQLGRDHLHIFPSGPWPMLREAGEPAPVGVLWNGSRLGFLAAKDLATILEQATTAAKTGERSLAIHSLLGHCVDDVLAIAAAAGLSSGYFWLHDFTSLCAGYHLLRNDVADCGAPPPESGACSICLYGPHRRRHLDAHRRLFEALALTVVSPSDATLKTWRDGWTYPAVGQVVAPHARFSEPRPAPLPKGGALRVAFPGAAATHKGWPVFRDLVHRFGEDPRYSFLHLGRDSALGPPVIFHPVSVTADAPLVMREALEQWEVDVALVWSLCRETFSFTAHEAVAAGAAVVTNFDSGNVAAFVEAGGHGLVLAEASDLMTLFETGEILRLARTVRRPTQSELVFSALTADLIEGRP